MTVWSDPFGINQKVEDGDPILDNNFISMLTYLILAKGYLVCLWQLINSYVQFIFKTEIKSNQIIDERKI